MILKKMDKNMFLYIFIKNKKNLNISISNREKLNNRYSNRRLPHIMQNTIVYIKMVKIYLVEFYDDKKICWFNM